jgi:hypothetical protein
MMLAGDLVQTVIRQRDAADTARAEFYRLGPAAAAAFGYLVAAPARVSTRAVCAVSQASIAGSLART